MADDLAGSSAIFAYVPCQNASSSEPIILKAFAVLILRKLLWLHSDLTAMKASPPAISPAAPLFI